MKPTIISPETKKNELIAISLCFIAALIFNIVSIIIFDTSWIELFSQIHIVLILTFVFYFVLLVLRGLTWLILKLVRKKQTN